MSVSVGHLDRRVILVGRTGLDAALRLDEHVELMRVATPLEAIAELASPLDAHSPSAGVVVIGEDAHETLRGRRAGSRQVGDALPTRERIVDFIRGLRMIDPGVVVLRSGPPSEDSDLYDGVADADLGPEHVREAIRSTRAGVAANVEQAADLPGVESPGPRETDDPASRSPTPDPPPIPSPPHVPPGAPWAAPSGTTDAIGDGALVEQLLKGQDVLEPALELIRARTGDPGVRFVPADAPDDPGAGVPVASHGFVHGRLAGAEPAALATHAPWLASWIRLRDQQAQLRHAAFTDPLTGAWNRRYLDRFMASAIEAAREHRWNVTILVLDIDNFKRFNDDFGHEAGDEILVETVRMLRSVVRPTDRVCRIGGDEFVVAFHEPTGPRSPDSKHPTSVFEIAHRFQRQILGHTFPKLAGCAPGTLTISGGLATYPWDGQTPGELLARADERAIESKRQGKNAIVIGPGGLKLGDDQAAPTP